MIEVIVTIPCCGKNWQCYIYSIASGCVTLGHVTPMYFQFHVNLVHFKHIYLALAHAHDVFFLFKMSFVVALWWCVGDLFLTVLILCQQILC
jgi:hypothetical protein